MLASSVSSSLLPDYQYVVISITESGSVQNNLELQQACVSRTVSHDLTMESHGILKVKASHVATSGAGTNFQQGGQYQPFPAVGLGAL